jgi:hypothetical protein
MILQAKTRRLFILLAMGIAVGSMLGLFFALIHN